MSDPPAPTGSFGPIPVRDDAADSDHQPPAFDDTLGAGGSSSRAFATAGTTVHIHCKIHAGMTATIFVE